MFSAVRIKVVPFVLLLALVFAFLLNWPVLLHFYDILSNIEHFKIGFVVSIPFLLVAALNFVFMPFSIRFLMKPFFAFLFVTGSIASYTMMKYRVLFDGDMIQNIFETNQSEAFAYVNAPIIIWVILTGLLPAALIFFVKIEYASTWYKGIAQRLLSMFFSLVIVGIIAALYYQDYASIGRNNQTLNREIVPANFMYSTSKYLYRRYMAEPIPFVTLGDDATRVTKKDKPTLMFLVVGETARGKNFSMNGYEKDTNPFTSKSGGVISFNDVRSCGTATAVSVPCMFSNMGRKEFDDNRARNSEGLLDVLQKTGISIFWKENDGGCKGVCDRVPNIEIEPKDHPKFCDKNTCYDEVVLQDLDSEIAQMKGDKLVGFHLIGSHGPTYYKRYPDAHRQFTPDCPRSDIENCTDEELTNTYDNTIRYTDFVIGEMIAKLKTYEDKYNTALLYVSDHGESLGALGLYLHGTPYKFAPDDQTRVPMQVWMSPGFTKEKGVDMACLQQKAADTRYSHDNIFSSVLGIWDVKTSVYEKGLDIFSQCRNVQ
ncbi:MULTISPECIES: MCR-3-related phosphoethanolamine--lipid A transferase [Aeromonas]|uniref:MCR-3-related phosphoethanolamine--lipid A transferase n=4 Tax=Aeromonas TaxID=642 RepID=A0AAF0GI98_AERCA|nr:MULTISPECIES: MCR-3-related phosphoethanolamine--lipid A transferase [Aeromonas]MBA2799561.1 MCR-3-related phosphoethanolamine--lipid A transferase [Aeromonas veronii]MBL0584160.1 MCR-3-related phosphoethanolamine--lipid A transferase [Aeromonas caviae]MBL0616832.1 MCR-3-related phosphoethanolamine--lipid A transferase [Aeromonas veronii]MBL0650373.1 MCR-3-related phosphoethanolamine--lipid A transferase [Aeromonas caviae]PNW65754.1 phosphoethanolamine transferase [Aeromonas veronii]